MPIRVLSCLLILMAAAVTSATAQQQVSGLKAEYLQDFASTTDELLKLIEAIPADKFSWRPGEGVRSVSEAYVHIAAGNFLLLAVTGAPLPTEYYPKGGAANNREVLMKLVQQNTQMEKEVASKEKVERMVKESLDAVRQRFSNLSASDLDKSVDFFGEKTTVRRVYIRILAHNNEHLGQMIAYARVMGIAPPWSRPQSGGK